MTAQKRRGSNQKVANSLVALSSAAVLAVYTAGYLRTRPAAQRFAVESAQRQIESPAARSSASPGAPASVVSTPPRLTASPRSAPTLTASPNAAPLPAPTEPSTSLPAAEPTNVQIESPTVPDEEPRAAEPPAASIAAQQPAPSIAARQDDYKDGTYLGWGSCRHGDIQASVVIQSGRIVSAAIAQCRTRYSCSWIEALPGQVVSRQNTNVDYVSGATQSTDAFADAVAEALSKAK
jgi:uncharacterized protein with FMN-binding domain